ncbi:unnamed protein product [Linum tenue]|uniref:APO domain-containing protein n=2 Tax=Linum tenue TaxID=586396 RepID=A0AAV0ML96_9ROSI|nr:unnamed protein product [Linum tenue]
MQRRRIAAYLHLEKLCTRLIHLRFFCDPPYADVPKPGRDKSERKPYVTPVTELIRRARKEREARKAHPVRMLEDPPHNGLLVPELVHVAHRVYLARESLLSGLAKLLASIPLLSCKFCPEVHVGRVGHGIRTCNGPKSSMRSATHVWRKGGVHNVVFFPKCFHLHDRVGNARVTHKEKHHVPRIPAILELCIQAGVDLDKYPTKRRTKPVYSVEGRIVDFEEGMMEGDDEQMMTTEKRTTVVRSDCCSVHDLDLKQTSTATVESWFQMLAGVKELMGKYSAWTCGFCPEVQVGPKGHKVRNCKATKHQARDGQHAWQEARIEDLIGPNYVWHVGNLDGPPLENSLKRYYGKAPAVVELCVHGGAAIPDEYQSMMRVDVVPPGRDEVDIVA